MLIDWVTSSVFNEIAALLALAAVVGARRLDTPAAADRQLHHRRYHCWPGGSIVKLLSDKREIDSLHGQIALGFLILQDIVVVLAMIVLSAVGIGAPAF